MKCNLKRTCVFFLALVVACVSMITAYAETIYYDNGLLYTYLNNDEVTICGAAEGVTEVKIPYYINYRYVVDIRNRAFLDNTEITSVDFSNIAFLRRIGSFAFSGCTNLSGELVLPETLTTMETAAFQDCSSLQSVIFNASTGAVPNQCFQGCTSLESVSLNDTVESIGYYAFADCSNLRYIEIPSSVTSIANSSFRNDDITLGVYYGSYAQSYAESRNIPYVILDAENIPTEPPTEPPTEEPTVAPTQEPTEVSLPILGDANGDGSVGIDDATVIQRHLADISMQIPYETLMHGDVDSDGKLSIVDATFIQRHQADMPVFYPIGEPIA